MYNNISRNISEHKQELMGLAICLIMLYHSWLSFDCTVVMFLKQMCNIGVDIFMLLSGFSVAYSFTKNPDVIRFLKKRMLRILPPYIVVFSLYYFYLNIINGDHSWYSFFYNLFFLNFFLGGNLQVWFIPAILVFYILTPLYIICINKAGIIKYAPYLFVLLMSACIMSNIRIPGAVFFERIPIFLIGINLFLNRQKTTEPVCYKWLEIVAATVALVGCFFVRSYNDSILFWLSFFLYIPIVLFIINNYKRETSRRNKILVFLGGITLEIYLVHERVQILMSPFISNQYLRCIAVISISLAMAYLLSKVLSLPMIKKYLT